MSAWTELVRASLLGTERQPFAMPQAGGGLGRILGRATALEPMAALLSAAAAAAVHRRIQFVPARQETKPETPQTFQDAPICPARATGSLTRMLNGEQKDSLPEFLDHLARCKRSAPAALLPALLEEGRQNPEWRDSILGALGARGHWLARHNPDWDYATAGAPIEWETSNREQRLALLREVRRTAPARARELLMSTWEHESPEDRADFLKTFLAGLSADDEPMLESILDDRRKEVRQSAADLLARLPGSALCARMTKRLVPLLMITPPQKGKLLRLNRPRKTAIEIALPEACDKALMRDGIEPKTARFLLGKKIGEKAGWLLQMIAVVPPGQWCVAPDVEPSALLEAAERTDWRDLLWASWLQATIRHGEGRWIAAFLARQDILELLCPDSAGLIEALPLDQRDEALRQLLDTQRELTACGVAFLLRHAAMWTPELSRVVLKRLRGHGQYATDARFFPLYRQCGRCMDPQVAGEASEEYHPPADMTPAAATALQEHFLDALKFRHDMVEALESRE